MTPEHKAKMAAGRERARLAREAKIKRLAEKVDAKKPKPERIAPLSEIFDTKPMVVPATAAIDPALAYKQALVAKVAHYRTLTPDKLQPYLDENPEVVWFMEAEKKRVLAEKKAEFDRMMGIAPESVAAPHPQQLPILRDDRNMPVENNPDPLGIVAKGNNPVRRILAQLTYPPDQEQRVVCMIASNMAPSWSEWNQEIADPAHPPVGERALVEHMKEYCMTLRPELPKTRLEPKYELKALVAAPVAV